ncbi:MAG: hypothetical protein HY809_09615 [Nitrospirae bacterium]|nr:hypothetical protein [Nitrospirota bacterium]
MVKIFLIASIISGIRSLLVSLKALRIAQGPASPEIEALKSASRLPEIRNLPSSQLKIYRLSAIIWFMLSMLFALPLLIKYLREGQSTGISAPAFSFLTLAGALIFIWGKISRKS